jgi:hypothetical protein
MTKERLQRFKSITTFGGVLVTVSGIILARASGGSWWSFGLSLFGLLLTCSGHWIGSEIAKHQALEKEADEYRILELDARIESTERFIDGPELRRVISQEQDRRGDDYDDGR